MAKIIGVVVEPSKIMESSTFKIKIKIDEMLELRDANLLNLEQFTQTPLWYCGKEK